MSEFEFWDGAENFAARLTEEEMNAIEAVIEDLYPEGIGETELNDLFWFEPENICEWIGLDYNEVMEREEE